MHLFNSSKEAWHSSVYLKTSLLFITSNESITRSADLDRNKLRVAREPVNLCTSVMVVNGCMSNISLTFSELGSIQLRVTIYLKNFSPRTAKAYFLGLSLILNSFIIRKNSAKSSIWVDSSRLLTSISST